MARTCAPSRWCWGTPTSRPPRSTRGSPRRACRGSTTSSTRARAGEARKKSRAGKARKKSRAGKAPWQSPVRRPRPMDRPVRARLVRAPTVTRVPRRGVAKYRG